MTLLPSPMKLLAGLALCALTACHSAPDKRLLQYLNTDGFGNRYVGNAEEENYVSIGDTISVFDALHPDELVATQRVDIDGTILLPEIGAVHVAGNTRSELEAILTEKYALYYDETDIKVSIRTAGKKFFVFGEVRREGEKRFEGDLTVFEAVMDADPLESSANLGRVRLIRPDPIDPLIITVNIGDMIQKGDSTFNVHVQERDIVFVPPTMWAELGYFIEDLLFPVRQVFRSLADAIFVLSWFDGGFTGNNNRRRF